LIQEGLFARLAADAGVLALVGGNIFAGAAPDDLSLYPCASYTFVGGSDAVTFSGKHETRSRVELNGHALTYAAAAKIRLAIIKALDGWAATLTDGTVVTATTLINPGLDFVGEDRIFRHLVEFYVDFNPPTS
jgi:hypothetical protein